MFSSGAARSLVPWWRLTAQSLAAGFFLLSSQITPILEHQLSRTLHNTLILDPCRNGRNLRVREVPGSIPGAARYTAAWSSGIVFFFFFYLTPIQLPFWWDLELQMHPRGRGRKDNGEAANSKPTVASSRRAARASRRHDGAGMVP